MEEIKEQINKPITYVRFPMAKDTEKAKMDENITQMIGKDRMQKFEKVFASLPESVATQRAQDFYTFAGVESKFNPDANRKSADSHKGILQYDKTAWKEATKNNETLAKVRETLKVAGHPVPRNLRNFNNVYDPVVVAAVFAHSPSHYMAHQQGAKGVKRVMGAAEGVRDPKDVPLMMMGGVDPSLPVTELVESREMPGRSGVGRPQMSIGLPKPDLYYNIVGEKRKGTYIDMATNIGKKSRRQLLDAVISNPPNAKVAEMAKKASKKNDLSNETIAELSKEFVSGWDEREQTTRGKVGELLGSQFARPKTEKEPEKAPKAAKTAPARAISAERMLKKRAPAAEFLIRKLGL